MDVLAPRSLRSTLFVLHPLYQGKRPKAYLLWGLGTGSGAGLCEAGTLGLSSMGKKYPEILSHYFPDLKLKTIKY
ncbi:MAG: hypothetical protein HY399_07095 [Elusimicrobia bacterium]|nr:hypothetical protein [Elusimicrobiota bacterium]